MSALVRRCWRSQGGYTAVHLFPAQPERWYGPYIALCGQIVPAEARPEYNFDRPAPRKLVTNPGPDVEARPCRRCAAIAKKREGS